MINAQDPDARTKGVPMRSLVDDITTLRVFSLVIETESFSEAGRRLGFTPATISKHVSGLEQRLGTRLINRTTRRLHITEAGMIFYQRCLNILQELERAESELSEIRREPTGNLRVTAPSVLAIRHISPHLPVFLEENPKISLELLLTSRKVDLFDDGIDLAIRIADTIEPGLIAIKLAPNRRILVAAPSYLDKHGEPRLPSDLQQHNCLTARGLSTHNSWAFQIDGGVSHIRISGNLTADNGEIIRDAVIAGQGIAMMPTFLISDDLKAGRLRPLLGRYMMAPIWMHAILPHRQYVPLKARCFIDFIKRRFGSTPYWDDGLEPFHDGGV